MGDEPTILTNKVGMLIMVPGFGNFAILSDIIEQDDEPYIRMYGSPVISTSTGLVPEGSIFEGELFETVDHILSEMPDEVQDNTVAVIPCHALEGYEPDSGVYIINNDEALDKFVKDPDFDIGFEIELK